MTRSDRPTQAPKGWLGRMAQIVVRRPRLVLLASAAFVLVALGLGLGAAAELQSGGFSDPHSASQRAADRLQKAGLGEPNLILTVTPRSGWVATPDAAAYGRDLTARLAATPGVRDVRSYWTTGSGELESRDGRQALVAAVLQGSDAHITHVGQTVTAHDATAPQGHADATVATVHAGGTVGVDYDTSKQVGHDLARAEMIAIPLTLLLLVAVFGSAVAGLLPVLIGLIAIAGSLAALDVIGRITNVSIYAEQLVTALGLGLAIDYSLLVVNRFRERLAAGDDTRDAVIATVATAGRTVMVSAATVSCALATLLVFPLYFLRSMAYAGIPVVIIAALGATVVLPALLALLGPRVNAGHLRFLGALDGRESRLWLRLTRTVLRRPLIMGGAVLAVLLVAAVPLLHVRFGVPDDRVLPSTAASHQVGDALRSGFALDDANTLAVVTDHSLTPPQSASYAERLSGLAGITAVEGPTGTWESGRLVSTSALPQPADATWLSLISTADPQGPSGRSQVAAVRAAPVPDHATVYVGGAAASLADLEHTMGSRLPIALALIALMTIALLFLYTGSVVLPLKALALNALSLSAVLGISVWIFQSGHLSGLLGFIPGPLAIAMPVLLFVIAFGLSMDYEVFVLSRIKELHDAGHDDTYALSHGLARSGRLITTAAALLSITFFSFGTSQLSFLQLFGIGTALAILIDATLIRGVLVPAFMRLAGPANWWAPAALRRRTSAANGQRKEPSCTPPHSAPARSSGASL